MQKGKPSHWKLFPASLNSVFKKIILLFLEFQRLAENAKHFSPIDAQLLVRHRTSVTILCKRHGVGITNNKHFGASVGRFESCDFSMRKGQMA